MILLLCRLSVDYLTCPLVEFVSSLWVCCYMFFFAVASLFFIYLSIFFFCLMYKRKKKSLSDILKLTTNGLDLPLSTPTQPNPHLLLHPSIHPCFTRGTQVLSLCFKKEKWASSVFFLPFMTVFSKNTIFFQEPSPLSLFFSLSCGVVLIYGSRSAQLKHLPVVRLIKVDRLDSTHGAAALMEGHNSE